MEDGKNSVIEKEKNFNSTTDLASLKLMLDYVGFKGIDPTSQLEDIEKENSLIGAYVSGSIKSTKHFLLITEYNGEVARGFRVSIWRDSEDTYVFYSSQHPVEFPETELVIKKDVIIFRKFPCKRISFQDFSRVYTASKVMIEMRAL